VAYFYVLSMDSPLISRTSSQAIIRILAKQKPGLKIIHLNAQSLAKKIEEFRFLIINSKLMLSVYPKRGLSPLLVICQLCVKVLIFFAPIVVDEVDELLFI